jgi:hypothetical protein
MITFVLLYHCISLSYRNNCNLFFQYVGYIRFKTCSDKSSVYQLFSVFIYPVLHFVTLVLGKSVNLAQQEIISLKTTPASNAQLPVKPVPAPQPVNHVNQHTTSATANASPAHLTVTIVSTALAVKIAFQVFSSLNHQMPVSVNSAIHQYVKPVLKAIAIRLVKYVEMGIDFSMEDVFPVHLSVQSVVVTVAKNVL